MRTFPKPVVVTSRCFEFDACRYSGQTITNNFVEVLVPWVEFRPVCPELEIGLGVPRDPIRIVRKGGERRLVQPSTGRDLTALMREFSARFLGSLGDADGFILKSRSPSCGLGDAKEFPDAENEAASGRGSGFFAGAVMERFPGLAVEDEGRLRNFRIREHFLTELYTLARFRDVRNAGTASALVNFHTDNKLLLMSYSQKEMRALGRITANARPFSPAEEAFLDKRPHARARVFPGRSYGEGKSVFPRPPYRVQGREDAAFSRAYGARVLGDKIRTGLPRTPDLLRALPSGAYGAFRFGHRKRFLKLSPSETHR